MLCASATQRKSGGMQTVGHGERGTHTMLVILPVSPVFGSLQDFLFLCIRVRVIVFHHINLAIEITIASNPTALYEVRDDAINSTPASLGWFPGI